REERYYFGDYEIYHKFVNDSLETERTTVNISDDKKKIATAETLTIDQGSLTVNPVAIIRCQYDNHLGSASLELDESAAIISYEEYHPFGTSSYRSGRTETETSQKRYKYVGKERDEETGLYYYGFRYYAAWLCRFVSVDPLQFDYPYYTPFQYAGNKPITYIDLDGLEEAKPDEKDNPPQQSEESTGWYIPNIKKFDYNGTWVDYASAIDNGVIDLLNIVPQLWNSGVANVENLAKGTWTETMGNELSAMGKGIKDWAVGSWNYTLDTPIDKQFIDAGKQLIQPQTLELATSIFVGSKIPSFKLPTVSKGVGLSDDVLLNLSDDAFVHITPSKYADNILKNGLDPAYSGGKSYVTRWGSVKNVNNASDFNTILYRKNLWKSSAGKFDGGATILQINARPTFFSPRTNWTNGVPQYIFTSPVSPKYITPITSLK
ncbi:RHS repeat-associated core domain-containing protein, partial [Labilibaculum euxinus]